MIETVIINYVATSILNNVLILHHKIVMHILVDALRHEEFEWQQM